MFGLKLHNFYNLKVVQPYIIMVVCAASGVAITYFKQPHIYSVWSIGMLDVSEFQTTDINIWHSRVEKVWLEL